MRRALRLCHAAALATLLALTTAAHGHEVEGLVVSVQDGDTLTVLDQAKAQHRVRIAGIDAPEKAQPFGEASKAGLGQLAFGKRVAARCHKHDRYGREVCSVYIATSVSSRCGAGSRGGTGSTRASRPLAIG